MVPDRIGLIKQSSTAHRFSTRKYSKSTQT